MNTKTFSFENKNFIYMYDDYFQKKRVDALHKYLTGKYQFKYRNIPYDYDIKSWTEPNTIEWITKFKENETFYDIGANVGIFSIFAGILKNMNICAFEPSINESVIMNKNIFLNKLDSNIKSFGGIAISNDESFDILYVNKFNAFQNNFLGKSKNEFLEDTDSEFAQGCFKTSIDNLIFKHRLEKPDHIKIDVDGIEHLIIDGAKKTLQNKIPQSINIEINFALDEHKELIKLITSYGYESSEKYNLDKFLKTETRSDQVANLIFYKV